MSESPEASRCPVKCVNCGEIMAASVLSDGSIVPIGIENSGKCGNAQFEVLASPGEETAESGT